MKVCWMSHTSLDFRMDSNSFRILDANAVGRYEEP